MEQRNLNISFNKSGNGYLSPKLTLPINWIKAMNISQENRTVKVSFDETKKQIIIEK